MTVLEAIERILARHKEYNEHNDTYNIIYEVDADTNILHLKGTTRNRTVDFDWSFVDIHTVENTYFTGYILDLDMNRNLKSLDGMIFDGNYLRASGTGIDRNSIGYIRLLLKKVKER